MKARALCLNFIVDHSKWQTRVQSLALEKSEEFAIAKCLMPLTAWQLSF
jgi:hypothetical protein